MPREGVHTGQMLALAAGGVNPQDWRCCRGTLTVLSRALQFFLKSVASSGRHLEYVSAVVCMAASPQGGRRPRREHNYCMG